MPQVPAMLRMRRHRRVEDTVRGECYSPADDREPLPEPPEKSLQQLQSIRSKVRQSSILQYIDEKRLTAAIRHMTLREVRAGEIIFRQEEPGDHFYLVEEGRFDMYERDDYEEDELGGISASYNVHNACIHEIVLSWQEERSGTLKAATDGKLWEIHRRLYTIVLRKMDYERRLRHQGYLSNVPMLQTLEPYEKVRLCDAVEEKEYPNGEEIFSRGDEADGIYFMEAGEAELDMDGEIKTLKKGDHFGERALLLKAPREATVTARENCEVAFLETGAFERLIGKLKKLLQRDEAIFKKICMEETGEAEPDEGKLR